MNETSLKKSIVKNSFWNLVTSVISKFGGLFFTIILARFLMPKNYGIYSIVLSVVMIFYIFADLGINETLSRYISLAVAKNKKKIPAYHKYLLKLKLVLSISVSILLILLAYPISKYFFKNMLLFLPIILASFYVLVLSLEGFYARFFYPIEKIKYLSIREILTQTLRIILVILVFYFIASSYQVIGIFFSLILVHTFILVLILFYLRKLIPGLFSKSKEKINKKEIRRFVLILTIASISGVLFSYIDAIMIGFFLLSEYVGYYKAAFSIVIAAGGFIAFPTAILLPIFTKINKNETEKVLNKVIRYLMILAIPSSFGLMIFSKYIIRTLFGYSYLPSSLPLSFLAFLIFPMICIGAFLPMFSAKGKPQIFAKLIIIAGVMNIILNIILIKLFLLISSDWAMVGAALATLISWTFYFIASFYVSKKQFNLKISLKPMIKPVIASLIMAGILFYSLSLIKEIEIVSGILVILFGVLIYFMLMILIKGIVKEDFDLFRLLIKK